MRTDTPRNQLTEEQGFALYVLRSDEVELGVVPELGGRIISLKNARTGREWMWHPNGGLKLFHNDFGDDFSRSTLAGTDECLPTIAPCSWRGRQLPDHGEVWSASWRVDDEAWARGVLRTSVELPISPFDFERTLEVRRNRVRINYRLTNRGKKEEEYLWALHPLLRLQPGDRLHLPQETRALLDGEGWLGSIDSSVPVGGCAKTFASPLVVGEARIFNPGSGDQLIFDWNPTENNTLGLWLTRGGWHGHHHVAIEPSNGSPDPLAMAAARKQCGAVSAFGSVAWSVTLRVEP